MLRARSLPPTRQSAPPGVCAPALVPRRSLRFALKGALAPGLMVRSLPERSAAKRLEPWAAPDLRFTGDRHVKNASRVARLAAFETHCFRNAPQDEVEREARGHPQLPTTRTWPVSRGAMTRLVSICRITT